MEYYVTITKHELDLYAVTGHDFHDNKLYEKSKLKAQHMSTKIFK